MRSLSWPRGFDMKCQSDQENEAGQTNRAGRFHFDCICCLCCLFICLLLVVVVVVVWVQVPLPEESASPGV